MKPTEEEILKWCRAGVAIAGVPKYQRNQYLGTAWIVATEKIGERDRDKINVKFVLLTIARAVAKEHYREKEILFDCDLIATNSEEIEFLGWIENDAIEPIVAEELYQLAKNYLTERQWQVVELVCNGYSFSQCGKELGITKQTAHAIYKVAIEKLQRKVIE